MERILKKVVTAKESGQTVRSFLQNEMGFTKAQIRSLKYLPRGICVNGEKVRVTYVLSFGDRIEICLEQGKSSEERVAPVSHPVEILYEDRDVIAVWKPSGTPTHPVASHKTDTMANYLLGYFSEKQEKVLIRVIGRLDVDTQGILLFGKNRTASAKLWKQHEQGILTKEYLAKCEGIFPKEAYKKEQKITMPVGKCHKDPGNSFRVNPEGKTAVTYYQVLDDHTVRLRLETGRTHQIRIHMAAIGHPLEGDALYGNGKRGETRAALAAWKLEFRQPFTGEEISLKRYPTWKEENCPG
ncbi:MAG: RluA family pseudouridine synthase [Blautia sp.]|nr:RluA family pseudouridine synthase [Blautia sp.]